MSISTPFIKRPIATSLIMAAILLVGLAAYPLLPVAPLPNVDFPTIQVTGQLPGASPDTIAATVAQPLERQFAQIPGVSQMTSTSVLGQTQVIVQFDLARNIDAAAQDVQAAINAASGQLPTSMPSPPSYRKVNPSDSPILILAVQSDELPLITVDDFADNILSQQISQIPGVAQVSIGGEQKRAIRVQVDPARLAAMGLTLEDVRGMLINATVNNPKGNIDGARTSFTIYDNDQLSKASEFENVVLAYRNGAPVRVKDIGHAIDAPENDREAGWQNGHRGIQLVIFKQPDANVIQTVDRIKAELPRLVASIPPSVHVQTVMDRTLTIRASVTDVQFTLMLSIGLVVMVIFLFLRNAWATIIPSVAVPLALVGTFAVMYVMGYSLDNLSLMALTIAVGFVVDDAIVMLENIYRHVEEGMRPMAAALKGAGEIGFTIVSISFSLIAVFIPLLLMGGIVGRLFREFAMTVSIAVLVSAIVSLTLTPMMCSRFLRQQHSHGRLYRVIESFFEGMIGFYRRTLDIALRFQFITLLVFLGTLCLTAALYITIPKGFFPDQDTGVIIGLSEAGQDVSFQEMARRQEALAGIIEADPDVAGYSSSIGAGLGAQTENNGRFFIALKPFSERHATAQQIIARLRPKLAKVEGAKLYLQAAQDIRVGGRLSKTQYQYTLQDADTAELYGWAPKVLAKLGQLPELRDVGTDQQMAGPTATLTIDRDAAARFGIQPAVIDATLYDAFGQRQVTQYFSQVNSYHLILEVLARHAGRRRNAEEALRERRQRPGGAALHLRQDPDGSRGPARGEPPGPVPGGDALLQPRAGHRARPGRHRHRQGHAADRRARHLARHLPGHRPGLPVLALQPALSDRRRHHRRVHHPRHPLRKLHPAAHHPVHPALGRRRRAAHADRVPLRSQRHRPDRRHPAHRHRQEERHHDGGLRHHRRATRRRDPARGHPPGLPAPLPPDPHDHDGRPALRPAAHARTWRRIGAPPPARLRHGRRPHLQPGADALHHARHLSLSRPPPTLARPAPRLAHAASRRQDDAYRGARTWQCRERLSGSAVNAKLTAALSARR